MKPSQFFNYLEFERRYSPHTLRAYRQDFTQFADYLTATYGDVSPKQATHFHIRSWVVQLMDGGTSARTVNRKLSTLKTYYRFLTKRGERTDDPMVKVRAPKVGKRLPATVKPTEIEHLLDRIVFPDDFAGRRDRLVISVLYQTGMRRSELANLRTADLDFLQRQVRVMGKRSKQRLIPFGTELAQELQRYILERDRQFPERPEPELLLVHNDGAPLGDGRIYRIVRKYLGMVTTADQRSPHVLRHSFATHLSDNGADLNAVKELLGHTNLSATQIYTHNSIDQLRRVYERAHPKAKED